MSEVLLLTIGAAIFAVTTTASVMAGGLMMSRVTERDRQIELDAAPRTGVVGPTVQ